MRKYLRAVAVASMIASLGTGTNAVASTSTTLAKLSSLQILNVSLNAARAQKSVESLLTTTLFGYSANVRTQSNLSTGRSMINVNGHSGEVLEVNGVVFAKLDADIVNFEFHVNAPSLANKWISIPHQSRYFSTVASGITLPSVLRELTPAGTLTHSITRFEGARVVALSGRASSSVALPGGTQVLYVSMKTPFLPVGARVHLSASGVNINLVVHVTNWGAPVHVGAPHNATTISTTTLK